MYNDFTRTANMGHFMLALDVARWMAIDQYHARYDSLVAALKGSGPDVLLPGEMRWKAYRENEVRGVAIDPTIAKPVGRYALDLGITPPFAVD
jgi:LDH2 family malate/lactate/ureidoglycolate dehydrogenase